MGMEDLYGDDGLNEAAAAETPAVETPVAPAEKETPAVAAPAEPAAAAPAPHMVPLTALLDQREQLQAARREAEELRKWRAEQERVRQQAAAQAPHPIEDPDGFADWVQNLVRGTREHVMQEVQGESFQQRAALSREMMEDQLGEKFADLAKFIDAAPDAMHDAAKQQAHPYRWFHRQFQAAEKARKADALTAQLGDRSIDDLLAEKLAAAKAEWQAELSASAQDGRARNADGTFASPQTQQRRSAPSLAVVNGAPPLAASAPPTSALEALYGES